MPRDRSPAAIPNRSAFAGVFAATLLCFLAVGAVLPVLPRYVTGPLGARRPRRGHRDGRLRLHRGHRPADRRADRRPPRAAPRRASPGCCSRRWPALLYYLPLGVGGLIFARLVLGVGDGWVFTAGLAWAVDVDAARAARAVHRASTGSACGAGCRSGRSIGEGLYHVGGYDAVWAFAAASPLLGALLARVGARPPRRLRPGGPAAAAAAARRSGRASRSCSPRSATPRSPASSCCTSTRSASATARRCSPRSR